MSTAPSPSITLTTIVYKVGRRKFGKVFLRSDGNNSYLAYRKNKEVFRSGEKTTAEAISKLTACWAIDDDTVHVMRHKYKCRAIGVVNIDTGERYMVGIEAFYDRSKMRHLNYEDRGGALQRYMPLQHFTKTYGKIPKRLR